MKGVILLAVSVVIVSVYGKAPKDCLLDVGFLLDGGKSITLKNWKNLLLFVKQFERQVNFEQSGTRIGVVSFGRRATVNIKLNQFNERTAFEKELLKIPYKSDNYSKMASGFQELASRLFKESNGDREKITNFVVVLTDAWSLPKTKSPLYEAGLLKKKGTKIFAVITKPGVNKHVMKYVASPPMKDHVYEVEHISDLNLFITAIVRTMCKQKPSTVVWFCSFEKAEPKKCNIKDDLLADFIWNVKRGRTPTRNTGPDAAYDGVYYAFLEASQPRIRGDKAVMYLPYKSIGQLCLSFYYHMFGSDMGTLEVIARTGHKYRILWKKSGQHGRKWYFAEAPIDLRPKERIGILGIRGNGSHSDMAVDLLRIRQGPCVEKA